MEDYVDLIFMFLEDRILVKVRVLLGSRIGFSGEGRFFNY